jgi:hypothetical protein
MRLPNKSLQRTWLSRTFQVAFFGYRCFGDCWARCLSRHAAELPPLGGSSSKVVNTLPMMV